jgi:hypothetical protein
MLTVIIWSLNEEWQLNNETVVLVPDFDRAPLRSRSFDDLKYIRKPCKTMQGFGFICFGIQVN